MSSFDETCHRLFNVRRHDSTINLPLFIRLRKILFRFFSSPFCCRDRLYYRRRNVLEGRKCRRWALIAQYYGSLAHPGVFTPLTPHLSTLIIFRSNNAQRLSQKKWQNSPAIIRKMRNWYVTSARAIIIRLFIRSSCDGTKKRPEFRREKRRRRGWERAIILSENSITTGYEQLLFLSTAGQALPSNVVTDKSVQS